MSISETTKLEIITLQKKYPEKRSALIPSLHLVQKECGYLSTDVQAEVADLFDIAPNEVHSIVSFYDMFFDKPVGKRLIHVCTNVSCMLRGSDQLLSTICNHLCIKPGETTADGKFTVVSCECLAACDKAPVMLVDEDIIGPVKEEHVPSLLQHEEAPRE